MWFWKGTLFTYNMGREVDSNKLYKDEYHPYFKSDIDKSFYNEIYGLDHFKWYGAFGSHWVFIRKDDFVFNMNLSLSGGSGQIMFFARKILEILLDHVV